MEVHVEQAGHDLVDSIKRRPHAFPLLQPVEQLDWESTQIAARGQRFLAARQAGHDLVAASLEFQIVRGREAQSARGEVVSGEMAAQFRLRILPSTQRVRGRRQPGVEAEGMEEAIRPRRSM